MAIAQRYSEIMLNAWSRCDEFNQAYPVGTRVRIKTDDPNESEKPRMIRSEAWANANGETCVMVEGKPSGVRLDLLERY